MKTDPRLAALVATLLMTTSGTLRAEVSLTKMSQNIQAVAALPSSQQPDGFLQLICWILNGPPAWPSNFKVEKVSGDGVSLSSVQLSFGRGKSLHVRGIVQRAGIAPFAGHLDLLLLNANRILINSWKLDYFPREIPHNFRGLIGRSTYATTIYPMPPKLSIIVIKYHGVGSYDCDLLKAPQ